MAPNPQLSPLPTSLRLAEADLTIPLPRCQPPIIYQSLSPHKERSNLFWALHQRRSGNEGDQAVTTTGILMFLGLQYIKENND